MALRRIGLCVLLGISCSLAKPLMTHSPLEGSTEEEELSHFTSSVSTNDLVPGYRTTTVGPTHVQPDFLSHAVRFLEENMLLILVSSTFILLLLLIITGAIFMSRRRKVNAYYPSSFPSQMYVDHRDKTGGAKVFDEVPEKPESEQDAEPVDSHRQLQEDIMRAAKSLRTPNKPADAAERSDHSPKAAGQNPEAGSTPDGGVQDRRRESRGAATDGGPTDEPRPEASEQLDPERDTSQEPLMGRSLRPSSLHLHNDSATLQLMAGEKTAF
ncbi:transmembrane protein 119b [Betta splendens]|uniref:Transmembrane protein 119b n=1 Tax=Betta splendens TaxID=158456 RepID=A0A6P7P1F2_BETSP|nr:transmembrane protein 119b [Betta splendens]